MGFSIFFVAFNVPLGERLVECLLTKEYPTHKKIQTLADGLLELRQQIEEIRKYFPVVVSSD